MKYRTAVAFVLSASMVLASVVPVGAFHCEGGILGKLKERRKSGGCSAAKTCAPSSGCSTTCSVQEVTTCSAPAPAAPVLPCCPCPSCSESEVVVSEPEVVVSEPVTESLPCCPCPSCSESTVVSEPVVESLPCCETSSEVVVDEGTIVSEGMIVDEDAIVDEGTVVDEGTIITGSDSMEGVVLGDSSGETIISEEIISTDVIGSSEDSTTAGETTPAEIDTDASTDAVDAAADTTTDLLDDFAPSVSPSDGATFKKRSSKVRFVFVRTNTLAKARQAEVAKTVESKKTAKVAAPDAKPVLRLSFSTSGQ